MAFALLQSRPVEQSDQFFLAIFRLRKMKYPMWCNIFSLEKMKARFSGVWAKKTLRSVKLGNHQISPPCYTLLYGLFDGASATVWVLHGVRWDTS